MEIEYNTCFDISNFSIIDLRDEEDYLKKHLNNSINISYKKILIYHEKYLDKNKKYLLICERGITSKKVSEILNKMGYLTYSLCKGFKNFEK